MELKVSSMAGYFTFIKEEQGTSVSSLTVTDCFTADYEMYNVFVKTADISTGAGTQSLRFRFLNTSGTEISSSNYDNLHQNVESNSIPVASAGAGSDSYLDTIQRDSTDGNNGSSMLVYQPFSSSHYTNAYAESIGYSSETLMKKCSGILKLEQSVTGIKIFLGSGSFDGISVAVYGFKYE